MPEYKFIGTDKYQKHWYFEHSSFPGLQESGERAVVTTQLQVIWLKPEDIYKVVRSVASIEIKYANGRHFICLLDKEHATMVLDRTKNNTLRTHFFMYRGFVGSVPFTYEVHSRYKKYQGLKGLIE